MQARQRKMSDGLVGVPLRSKVKRNCGARSSRINYDVKRAHCSISAMIRMSRIRSRTVDEKQSLNRRHQRAERMGGINAEDRQLAREEAQFFQCEPNVVFLRMSLDIGIKLCCVERAAELIAFELGHVDAVGRETAHGLV